MMHFYFLFLRCIAIHSMSKVDLTCNPSIHLPSLWSFGPACPMDHTLILNASQPSHTSYSPTIFLECCPMHSLHFLVLRIMLGIHPSNVQCMPNFLGTSSFRLRCYTNKSRKIIQKVLRTLLMRYDSKVSTMEDWNDIEFLTYVHL